MSTSSRTQSATHRGVDFWKIVTWVGLLLAGSLYTVDPLELLFSPVVPICFVADEPDPPVAAAMSMKAVQDRKPIGGNSRSTQQWKDVPRGTMVSPHARLNLPFKLTTRPRQRLFYLSSYPMMEGPSDRFRREARAREATSTQWRIV
jgi:hypothetical protein